MPIPEKLGVALKKNSARVIDLFRQWDTDGDGGAFPEVGFVRIFLARRSQALFPSTCVLRMFGRDLTKGVPQGHAGPRS